MASDRHHIVVDLTDDSSDVPSTPSSSSTSNINRSSDDHSRSSYISSPSNPAKRSRIEPHANLNPLALLNPRAYISNGSSSTPGGYEIQSFPSRAQQELNRAEMSFNKRMENLHGLKDRKIKTPTPREFKRSDTTDSSQDRHAGNSLLSKNVVNDVESSHIIDLTGSLHA
jgi:hypothetical protein